MYVHVAILVSSLVSAAGSESSPTAVRSFNSQKCLANIGKPGVGDCTEANMLSLVPVDATTVMLRAQGNNCLFSNKDGRFAWYGCNAKFNDQHWQLVAPDVTAEDSVRSSGDGWRMLKNVNSGRCLFSNKDGRFGVYNCTQGFNDQFWQVKGGAVEAAPASVAKASGKAMSDADFQVIVEAIKSASFSADQLGALDLGKKGKLFSVAQVGTLIELFSFSADKLAALKSVRAQIADHNNEVQLLEKFTFSADKTSAREILSN